jgi:sn-glycerol 3-phosphate transport system permease protein
MQDAFGLSTEFVGFENYRHVLQQRQYYNAMVTTGVFSFLVALFSLGLGLLLASQADKNIKGANPYKTLLLWPYAVAPAIAGVLWLFLFHPSLGTLSKPLRFLG